MGHVCDEVGLHALALHAGLHGPAHALGKIVQALGMRPAGAIEPRKRDLDGQVAVPHTLCARIQALKREHEL